MTEYGVVVLGAAGVGKTALTVGFVTGHFQEDLEVTVDDSYRKQHFAVDGETCLLDILDTADQEHRHPLFLSSSSSPHSDFRNILFTFIFFSKTSWHSALKDQYLRRAEGFVIVYAVTSRSSFESVAGFRDRMLALKMLDAVPMVVVGNKCDLDGLGQRAVATGEGAALTASFGPSCRFIEISAQSRTNVDEAFAQLVRAMRQPNAPPLGPGAGRRHKCSLF
jgi:GTPase KRas protein